MSGDGKSAAAARLGAVLYDLREDMGLSQKEMAAELGISQSTVSRWEAGGFLPWRIHKQRLYRLAPGLETEIEELWRDARRDIYHHPRSGGRAV